MNCLVLGGAGFIGSHIVDALIAAGHHVRVFDRPHIDTENLQGVIDSIEIMGGDFNNVNDIADALTDIDVVVHLVCTTVPGPSNENPVYDIESNVIGTANLLRLMVEKGCRKILFASSGGTVYGIPQSVPISETHPTDPICSYGITKLMVEKYMRLFHHLYGLDYTVLRLSNPYGERQRTDAVQGAAAVFLGRVLRDQPITIWGDGSVARDYFHISDLVAAFLCCIETDPPSKLYNIGSGEACSLTELLEMIRKVTGKTPDIRYTPSRKLDVPVNCLDIRRAKAELGWEPKTGLKEGIEQTWNFLKQINV